MLGNHDHWEWAEATRNCMKRYGITLLDNKSEWIKIKNDSIKIGGVGNFWEDVQNLDSKISDVSQDDFCILLMHNPDYVPSLKTDKIDLILAGHTHGGTGLSFWAVVTLFADQSRTETCVWMV